MLPHLRSAGLLLQPPPGLRRRLQKLIVKTFSRVPPKRYLKSGRSNWLELALQSQHYIQLKPKSHPTHRHLLVLHQLHLGGRVAFAAALRAFRTGAGAARLVLGAVLVAARVLGLRRRRLHGLEVELCGGLVLVRSGGELANQP